MKKLSTLLVLIVSAGLVFAAGSWVGWRSAATGGPPQGARKVATYTCPMHPAYRADRPGDCPSCGMRLVPVQDEDDHNGRGGPGAVRLTAERQQLIGVRTDAVQPAAAAPATLRVPGRIAVDEQRVYRITAAVDGWIRNLGENPPGSFVREQQVLATYYAQSLVSAVQSYVFALQTNAHAQAGDATIGYQRGATVLSLQNALDSLRALGMSDFQIKEIDQTRVAPTEVRVYSPINGFVTARNVTPEQRFDKGTELFRIADIGRVWVMAEIFEKDVAFLKPGARATVIYQGRRVEARMSNALPQFDPQTRTLKTRFELDNPGDLLRPDMFVDVELHVDLPSSITVPADAVVDSGLRKTVFVERGNGYFEPRPVSTGWRMGDRVEITRGLMPGERVVISGNFLLDSESRMKSAAMGIFNPEVDPVCGMEIDRDAAKNAGRIAAHGSETYYFCSDDCRKKFQAEPARYAEGGRREAEGGGPKAVQRGEATQGGGRKAEGGTSSAPAAAMPQAASREPQAATSQAASRKPPAVKDLVCGMDVDPKDKDVAARKVDYNGKAYFFCSDDCKDKFRKNPAAYIKAEGGGR